MIKTQVSPLGDRPVYCAQCRGFNTFEHDTKNDVKCEDTGKVLWEAWRCRLCSHTTITGNGYRHGHLSTTAAVVGHGDQTLIRGR